MKAVGVGACAATTRESRSANNDRSTWRGDGESARAMSFWLALCGAHVVVKRSAHSGDAPRSVQPCARGSEARQMKSWPSGLSAKWTRPVYPTVHRARADPGQQRRLVRREHPRRAAALGARVRGPFRRCFSHAPHDPDLVLLGGGSRPSPHSLRRPFTWAQLKTETRGRTGQLPERERRGVLGERRKDEG